MKAADIGGRILRKHYKKPNVYSKGYRDVVTDADLECERELKKFFEKHFPKYGFVGEEGARNFVDGKNWIVDPLDGTREFSYGIPYFSISIALLEGKKTNLGVVHNPITREYYHARLGGGACLNGEAIHCGDKKKLADSLSAGCFIYSRKELVDFAYKNKIFLLNYSPALDLCGVARGRIDSVVYTSSTFDDHGAGALIVREAGGKVSNFGSSSYDPFELGIMAGNRQLHRELCSVFPHPFEEVRSEEAQYTTTTF